MVTVYSPPVPTYTALADITLASTSTEVILSGFSQEYRDLVLVIDGQPSSNYPLDIDLNGETANTNYYGIIGYNQGGTTAAFTVNETYVGTNYYGSNGQTNAIVQFLGYSATDKHKPYLVRSNGASGWVAMSAHRWANTDAITSISVNLRGGSFTSGTTFKLFGIEA